jgi:transposase
MRIEPSSFVLDGRWSSQTLLVTDCLSDGSICDLTANAEFAPVKPGIVGVESTVRKREHRDLLSQGDDRLAGTKYLWLCGWENVPPSREEAFDRLKAQRLKTSRAWAIKELFRDFWACQTPTEAEECFQQWYAWAIRSRLEPIKRVARMLRRHLKNILTFFSHRLSNAALEGLNNRIAGLIKKAFGYRNRERLKTDILFHLGGLNLFPGQCNITR